MPLYFFDIDDGEQFTRDDTGTVLNDADAARKQAISILPDIARELFPDGNRHELVSTVRTEDGSSIFRACLTLVAGWLDAGCTPVPRNPAK